MTFGAVENNDPTFSASISIKFIFSPSPFESFEKLLLFKIFSKIIAVMPLVIFSSNIIL